MDSWDSGSQPWSAFWLIVTYRVLSIKYSSACELASEKEEKLMTSYCEGEMTAFLQTCPFMFDSFFTRVHYNREKWHCVAPAYYVCVRFHWTQLDVCWIKGFHWMERCWYVKVFLSGNVASGMLLEEWSGLVCISQNHYRQLHNLNPAQWYLSIILFINMWNYLLFYIFILFHICSHFNISLGFGIFFNYYLVF